MDVLRLAMWSGPRNISTALMRSFGSRPDTSVVDEPLYAHYLAATGAPHPGREEVLAAGETDWTPVVAALTGPVPDGKRIHYQKHMAHHLLPEIDRGWLAELRHAFLIRDPREMLLSLARVVPEPRLEDTGLPQELELFEDARRREGAVPPVLDARDVLEDPPRVLSELCVHLGIPFSPDMLRWEPGPRATDGVWARHWYGSVERSSGFEAWRPREGELPRALEPVLAEARAIYDELHRHRIR